MGVVPAAVPSGTVGRRKGSCPGRAGQRGLRSSRADGGRAGRGPLCRRVPPQVAAGRLEAVCV
eukprot:9208397-Lingulodinium_polyedra.AAC.1